MDRENLIEGLEYCKKHGALGGNDCNGHYEYTDNLQNIIEVNNYRKDCIYGQCKTGCVVTLIDNTLAMLKERAEEIERLKTPTAGDNHIPLRW